MESLADPNFRSSSARVRALAHPNMYVGMMLDEFNRWAFDEERAAFQRGRWRESAFEETSADRPLDLEIGTGNGGHFAHRARANPQRLLVGLELKFKPLVQSIRRALRAGCANARIARYDADRIGELFAPAELNDVFIHFPDPWPKRRNWKNRLVNANFLSRLHDLQKPGSAIEFKTDSRAYFDWALEQFPRAPYRVAWTTLDLHSSERASENFVTQFESLFVRQGLPIHAARLMRD